MKKRKSNIVLGALAFLVLVVVVSYSFHINRHLEKKPPPINTKWLLGKGAFFTDTLRTPYSHLVSDFRLMELSPKVENQVFIEGYENGRSYLKTDIRNDTLYIERAKPNSDTILVAVEDEYPVLVKVGAASLQSITLQKAGNIDIPVRPYGAREDGEPVFKPEDWDKYVLKNKSLDLILKDGSAGKFFFELDILNLSIDNKIDPRNSTRSASYANNTTYTSVTNVSAVSLLTGTIQKMTVLDPQGMARINVGQTTLAVDTLIVQSNNVEGSYDSGTINIHCNDYLQADLLYQMDIVYRGDPKVVVSARDYGRVINANQKRNE